MTKHQKGVEQISREGLYKLLKNSTTREAVVSVALLIGLAGVLVCVGGDMVRRGRKAWKEGRAKALQCVAVDVIPERWASWRRHDDVCDRTWWQTFRYSCGAGVAFVAAGMCLLLAFQPGTH